MSDILEPTPPINHRNGLPEMDAELAALKQRREETRALHQGWCEFLPKTMI